MGILGLTTFVQENFWKWERRKLKGKVVIDGYSLCFSLQHYYHIEWQYGGQYDEFREVVVRFVRQLHDSGITPIVVFDGIDFTGEKAAVLLRRRRESVHTIRRCFARRERYVDANVLPILLLEVFRETLEECEVKLYVVDGDADQQTAALANHHNCPVVSSDSDYYVFDVVAGYIPFSKLAWEALPVTGEVYFVRNFASQFKLDEQLRFFIPIIVGNDVLKPVSHPQFHDHVRRYARSCSSGPRIYVRDAVEFLSSFRSVEDLLDQVLVLRSGEEIKQEMLSKFASSQRMYSAEPITEDSLMCNTLLRFGDGSKLPEWVLSQYRKGYFASSLMETAVIGSCILRVVPDDPMQETSLIVSKPIRAAIYGILSPHLRSTFVKEMVRYQDDLREETVDACSFVRGERLPPVDAIQSLSPKQRLHAFCLVMGIEVETLMRFDKCWWLVVAVSCYWARTASPSDQLIKALILCLIESRTYPPRGKRHRVDSDLTTLHQYSKWQCVYLDAMKLNNLLLNPVRFVSPAYLFDGNLVMFYAQTEPQDMWFLVRKVPDPRLYSQLEAVVEDALPRRYPTRGGYRPPRQRREHGDGRVRARQEQPSAFLSGNRFAKLRLSDESSSDDTLGE